MVRENKKLQLLSGILTGRIKYKPTIFPSFPAALSSDFYAM